MAAKDDSSKKGEVNEGMGDMSQAAVKKMIAVARERGYITYDELNDVMPPDQVASEQIEDVMSMLSEMGINIIEADEIEDDGPTDVTVVANDAKEVTLAATGKETLDRTDDPVRMYLREMGSVELLSREGEIAIAKRIEAGRKTMIEGLCESPLTFQAITIWRDELLEEKQLPICLTGYTPWFRREAGSYGSHVRGLNRLHQFDKVEIVRLETPDRSEAALEEMVDHVRGILKEIGIPYRILRLCGGDLGFTSALTYDFELFSTAQEKWLEISSVSTFEGFQSERLKLRYKANDGSKHLVHTLNGSSLALPRVLAGILENCQTPEGIKIREAIVSYTGFDIIK